MHRTPLGFGAMLVLAIGWLGAQGALAADKAFLGEDAAMIDWAWKACEVASTKKQHGLAEQALNKGGDAYRKAYEQHYFKIVGATPTPPDVKRTCEQVKAWYGPGGSKIENLVETKVAKTDGPGTTVGSKASSASKGGEGGRRGGGGGGRGGR